MPPEDLVRLQHMLDAAETAIEFMQGRDRSALEHDRMLLFAVVRAVEVLGEAASKVTAETRERHADLPWRAASSMPFSPRPRDRVGDCDRRVADACRKALLDIEQCVGCYERSESHRSAAG